MLRFKYLTWGNHRNQESTKGSEVGGDWGGNSRQQVMWKWKWKDEETREEGKRPIQKERGGTNSTKLVWLKPEGITLFVMSLKSYTIHIRICVYIHCNIYQSLFNICICKIALWIRWVDIMGSYERKHQWIGFGFKWSYQCSVSTHDWTPASHSLQVKAITVAWELNSP